MTSPDLRRRLTELAQRFVEDVLTAIERAPLADIAEALPRATPARPTSRIAAPTEPVAPVTPPRAVVAPPRVPVAPVRVPRAPAAVVAPTPRPVVARAPAPPAPSPADDETARQYVRRSPEEIQHLRDVIVATLRAAKAPIPASEIAQEAGVHTAELAFPMAQLRDAGVVTKEGQRAKAVYWLVENEDDGDDRGKKKKKRK